MGIRDEHRDKLLAAMSAAGEVVTDLAETLRDIETAPDGGTVAGGIHFRETVRPAVDVARLVVECGGEMERDGQLLGALSKWTEENS
jgi:hypothetical protein